MSRKRWSPHILSSIGLLLSFICLLAVSQAKAQNINEPEGWIKSESNGADIFRPDDLPPGKLYFVIIFPDEPLNGKSLAQWLNSRIDTILAKAGTLIQHGTVEEKSAKILTCTSAFKPTSGEAFVSVFTAIAPRPGYGRLLVLTSSSDPAFMKRYRPSSGAILREFTALISEVKNRPDSPPEREAGTSSREDHPAGSAEKEADAKKKEGSGTSSG